MLVDRGFRPTIDPSRIIVDSHGVRIDSFQGVVPNRRRPAMSKTLDLPYYTIKAEKLADWLDGQPDSWWIVDGDPVLTSQVDFPCPSEELSVELRGVSKLLRLFDPRKDSKAHGEVIRVEQLDDIADTNNNSHARTYLLSWDGDDTQWLLAEYPEAANGSA
jgi:hypothetical protein